MDKRIKTTEKNITTVKNLNSAKDKYCQGQILLRCKYCKGQILQCTNTAKDKYSKGQILQWTNTARPNTAMDKYCIGQILQRANTAKIQITKENDHAIHSTSGGSKWS